MAKKKGRDWSEWQKQMTGMHRLEKEWKAPRHEPRIQDEETTASMVLPRNFQRNSDQDRMMMKLIIIFFLGLIIRKVYFEVTKYERVRNDPANISRIKK